MKTSKRRRLGGRWRLTLVSLVVGGPLSLPMAFAAPAGADLWAANDVQFNPSFIDNGEVDIKRFAKSGSALPGTYRADVYVNDGWRGRRDVLMKEGADRRVRPCFSIAMLEQLGVDFARINDGRQDQWENGKDQCYAIDDVVKGSAANFNSGDLRLDVSIPQLYLRANARGYVDPKYWDSGLPFAGFVNYNAMAYHYNTGVGGANNQYYLGVNGGLNVGLWRLRYSGALVEQNGVNGSQHHAQSYATYAQRDITDWHSVVTVGDSYTSSELFPGYSFRGVQLNSDDRMLPESMQGYAPVVRGLAESNAKVTIRQNGNIVYENTVPPGEFRITDLYNTGFAGDLQVTVTEADGRVKQFVVPYAAVPQLLREGHSRYSLTAGEWRDGISLRRPHFVQGTYQHGVNNQFTVYGGVIAAEHYTAGLVGTAINTPIGALGFDVTQAYADSLTPDSSGSTTMSGQSYRASYSKLMAATGTNFTLAAYRYSTSRYLEFRDYVNTLNTYSTSARTKHRFQLNIDQPLPEGWGHVFFLGSTQGYWNQRGRDLTYQAGYSNNYKGIGYSVALGRTRDQFGHTMSQVTASITLPLGHQAYAPMMMASVSRTSDQAYDARTSVSGSAGELHNFSYSVFGNLSRDGNGSNTHGAGGNLQYGTSVGAFTAGASTNGSSSQASLGMSGALVFHPGGVTASQQVGESLAVVEAPGAEGAAVVNTNGVRVNEKGYAVITNLMPYRQNDISLDPKGIDVDTELRETSIQDVPRAGAIVMLKFATQKGKPAVVTLARADGSSPPVGAEVSVAEGDVLTMVGQGGRVFLRGYENKPLLVSWGRGAAQQCRFTYQVPLEKNSDASYVQTEAVCAQ